MTGATIRLLSTRPLAGSLLESAAADGVKIETVAFISALPLTDKDIRDKIGWLAMTAQTVIFTSRNAVEAVVALLEHRPGWWIFCLGHGTRRLVEEHFGADSIAGAADSAAELAEKMITAKPKEVIFFCGDQRRAELPDRLSERRIRVEEIVVYKTLPTPKRIEAPYDGILFFSPSAVSSFFSVNTLAPDVTLFSIGGTTADAIRSKCPNPIFVSESPDTDVFVRDILEHYKTKSNNEPS